MVGQTTGIVKEIVGRRDFWRDPELNASDCATLIATWRERHGCGGSFYDLREANPGDVVAFGTGWTDVIFGIYLGDKKIATTASRKNCHGQMERKMILVRVETEGKPFIGGVHVG